MKTALLKINADKHNPDRYLLIALADSYTSSYEFYKELKNYITCINRHNEIIDSKFIKMDRELSLHVQRRQTQLRDKFLKKRRLNASEPTIDSQCHKKNNTVIRNLNNLIKEILSDKIIIDYPYLISQMKCTILIESNDLCLLNAGGSSLTHDNNF